MADSKITDYSALTGANLATGDLFEVVDVSDTTLAATGTNKKQTADELAIGLPLLRPPQGLADRYSGSTGCLASTYNRLNSVAVANVTAPASGSLRLFGILLPKGLPVTNITFWSGTTAGSNMTHQWFGLFDSSRVVLAKTADDTSAAWGASTAKTLAVTGGPFVTTYAGWHYVGYVVTHSAGAVPTIEGMNSTYLLSAGVRLAAPICSGTSTTGLTDPASCTGTQTAITIGGFNAYAEIS